MVNLTDNLTEGKITVLQEETSGHDHSHNAHAHEHGHAHSHAHGHDNGHDHSHTHDHNKAHSQRTAVTARLPIEAIKNIQDSFD